MKDFAWGALLGACAGTAFGWLLTTLSAAYLGKRNPFRADEYKRLKVGPKLSLYFNDADPACVDPHDFVLDLPWAEGTPVIPSIEITTFYFSVKVTNIKPRTAYGCRGYLSRIEKDGPDGAKVVFSNSLPLIWAHRDQDEDLPIPKGVEQLLNVVTSQSNFPGFTMQFRAKDGNRLEVNGQDYRDVTGIFYLTIVVTADDCPSESIKLKLDCDEGRAPKVTAC